MTTYASWLSRACNELELDVDFCFVFRMSNGKEVHPLARIMGLGAPNGMLLFSSVNDIKGDIAKEILHADYGYAVMDEPWPDEEFDLESFREVFSDWGWHKGA